jgi:HlyD family secretion protein
MKRLLGVLLVGFVGAVLGWLVCLYAPNLGLLGKISSGPASTDAKAGEAETGHVVVGIGRIEPAGGVIDVGAMMGDRLGRLLVEEGTTVKKGDLLAELESLTLRMLERDTAEIQLHNAIGRLAVERQLADAKIDAARLSLKKAESAEKCMVAQEKKVALLTVGQTLARKDQERLRGLSKDLVTEQERERQGLVVQQAESELESARSMLEQLSCTNQLGLDAARLDLRTAAEAKELLPFAIPIDSLRMSKELAHANYERSRVVAPCNGTVLRTHVRPGETLTNKPILQIANLDRMVVVVEVYENEVKHLRIGQLAVMTSKAFPSPFDEQGLNGKVVRIGRMISTPVLKSIDPFAPADRHVVEVRVALDGEGSRQAASLSNLQVDVKLGQGPWAKGQGSAETQNEK